MRPLALGTLAACAWNYAETPGATAVAGGGVLALDHGTGDASKPVSKRRRL